MGGGRMNLQLHTILQIRKNLRLFPDILQTFCVILKELFFPYCSFRQLLGRNNSSFISLVCRWRTITMLWWWEANVYSGWMLIQTSLSMNLWPSRGSTCGSFGELRLFHLRELFQACVIHMKQILWWHDYF